MSCPGKIFLDERKSLFKRKFVFPDVRMQAKLGLMFERKAKISCNGGRSVTKKLRARQDFLRTSRKTDFPQKNETFTELKITFVDLTHPGQRPELPSLSHHFLLCKLILNALLDFLLFYCNSLYLGLPDYQIQKIQRVQNAAARLVYNAGKHCHITPLLFKLHWLPNKGRVHQQLMDTPLIISKS